MWFYHGSDYFLVSSVNVVRLLIKQIAYASKLELLTDNARLLKSVIK